MVDIPTLKRTHKALDSFTAEYKAKLKITYVALMFPTTGPVIEAVSSLTEEELKQLNPPSVHEEVNVVYKCTFIPKE